MVYDRSRPITVCQFATYRRSSVILHTFTNVCSVIILEQGILFISIHTLLHFFRLFIHVACGLSQPVTNCHPFWRPVTDRVYWTCMEKSFGYISVLNITNHILKSMKTSYFADFYIITLERLDKYFTILKGDAKREQSVISWCRNLLGSNNV